MKNTTYLLALSLVLLVIFGTACSKADKPEYLASSTVQTEMFSDNQGSDVAISDPYKISDSDLLFVKVEHRSAEGSGGYLTVVTSDASIQTGTKLVLRTVHLLNNSEVLLVEAHKAPTPIGH